jgi:hypothetical protein
VLGIDHVVMRVAVAMAPVKRAGKMRMIGRQVMNMLDCSRIGRGPKPESEGQAHRREDGCSNQQIKAITGHKTDREVSRYTAAADQVRLSDQAMAALSTNQLHKEG